ncbi:BatD family protein [Vibrio sp. SCSIO 43137]|uniref:BatD family protein n=1 Tax=Vibrio sp. SCSIO 43137 TaxID=3021011 RepID=UPI0023081ED4|nr:BatD family protein [Vibrio sp. SCSIO 43137]WCE32317.1 BatD family protein [Vibrio sp. SCSIO 43137]
MLITIIRHKLPIVLTAILSMLQSPLVLAEVVATVTANKVAKGEVFVLKIVSDNRLQSEDIDFSVLDDDFFTGRPGFGSSINIINGKRTVRSEWNISLAPLRAGVLKIPSFTVGGEKTDTIYITASIDASAPSQNELVEYQVQLSSNEVFPQQVARLKTRLIIKTDIRRLQNPQIVPPSVSSEVKLEPLGQSKQYKMVIDGIDATIVDQDYSLSSQKPGNYKVQGPKLTGAFLVQDRSQGGTRLVPIDTPAEVITLQVAEKPQNYSGVWLPTPELTLTQRWLDEDGQLITGNQHTLDVGSPITRIITITAEGVLQSQLPELAPDYPDSVRIYPEPAQFKRDDNRVAMEIKQVIIPKTEGQTLLPPISLPWWNTESKQPETAVASALSLNVTASETETLTLASPVQAQSHSPQPEAVIIRDSGIWPYTTALFAFLWLVTSYLWLKQRKQPVTESEVREAKPTLTDSALISALKQKNGVQIQNCITRWFNENPHVPEQLKGEIEQEVAQIMSALYSGQEQGWDGQSLLNKLKKSSKSKT